MALNTFSQHLQNQVFSDAQKTVVSCRSALAMELFEHNIHYSYKSNEIGRKLDLSCGKVPDYDDFQPEATNGVLSFYNWIGQKVSFIPL